MLKIRLQRTGKRGQAYFRIAIVEHTKKPKGKALELLGNYNPHQKEIKVDRERVEYWMSKGAQISPTVNNLMVNYKIWDRPKMESWKPKKKVGQPAAPAAAPAPAPEPTPAA
jgi:small subunit ribosomal protein S16